MRTQPGSTLLVAAHSDKCVAIKGGVAVPVATAYQLSCTRTAGAGWNLQRTVVPRPDGGVAYHIHSASTGMCLDALNSGRRVGPASVIVQRPCVGESLSQLWRFEVTGRNADSTEGRFVNIEHEDCLNVRGGAVTDGAHIVRWPCKSDLNEIFRVFTDALDR